ncbi:hypothetical protein HELRODRAFT_193444 [Helobdella robusta]|uniref:Uncharacterized protein n=1 Tax=Helobdella robusta TaxID=6412 RepID=T1FUZ6_HELRO|nr:hypothetical protein HELRODRAFT_193444 [Helobdella robusta]ESN95942.1 hypothetical protein HELRODRAFT_193444 [Helobdella robusta]
MKTTIFLTLATTICTINSFLLNYHTTSEEDEIRRKVNESIATFQSMWPGIETRRCNSMNKYVETCRQWLQQSKEAQRQQQADHNKYMREYLEDEKKRRKEEDDRIDAIKIKPELLAGTSIVLDFNKVYNTTITSCMDILAD